MAGGAISNNDNLQSSGHVRVYEYPSAATGWTQVSADIDGTGFRDESGHACALSDDGSFLVIGAWKHDGPQGADSGEVRTFSYDTASASWQQLFNQALYGRQAGARFGKSLSLSDTSNTSNECFECSAAEQTVSQPSLITRSCMLD